MTEPTVQNQDVNRLESLRAALEAGTLRNVRRMLHSLHPAEVASLLESLPPAEREIVWELVDPEDDGEVLLHVNDEVRSGLIRGMDAEELLAATEDMDIDDLADLFADLPEAVTRKMVQGMDQQNRERLHAVLSYGEDTAGGLMNIDTVTVRPDVTLEVVLRYLRMREELPDNTDVLFVVNRYGRLLGTLPLTRVLIGSSDSPVSDTMNREINGIPAETSAREVAKLFEDRDLVSAPVVDNNNVLLGRITIDDVVDVIRDEAEHSIMSMAGLDEEEDLFAPVWKKAMRRWPWLGLNLFTAFIASRVVGAFEGAITQLVALAALMPIVAAIGGNTGNQTIALIIRAIALDQLNSGNARRLLTKELGVSVMNGLLWGLVVAGFAFVFYQSPALSAVIGVAMMLNIIIAALAGVFIPLLLKRAGRDPAMGSTIFLTATTDSMGFFIFLGLAAIFLV